MKKAKAKSRTRSISKARIQTTKKTRRGPVKHAKHLLSITPKFVHGMVAGAFVGLLLVGVVRSMAPANALSFNASRDCSTNAVIHCGALSTAELKARYHQQGGVPEIYRYFKIYEADINGIDSTVVPGVAYRDGTVRLSSNGKIVAVHSVSAGRERIRGSVRYIKDGVTFYITTSQEAFLVNAIPVYVSMKSGQFQFAIMPNCGNPVKATPTTIATPAPKPPVANVAPPVTPAPTPTPPETPVTVTPTTTITALPNTGPGAVIIIGLLAIIGGYVFHRTHHHIRKKHRQAHHHA